MSNPEKPDLHQAIQNLLEAMRANEAKAFQAGWNACYMRHSRNVLKQASGFEEAWSKYVDQREGFTA